MYESVWRGRFHHRIADEVAGLAVRLAPTPARVLDVGCGSGDLLRALAEKLPAAKVLGGIDASPRMVGVARVVASDPRLSSTVGVAEDLPYEDARFDLVVTTTSFDHWRDQQRGLAQCARVLEPKGHLLLADLFALAHSDARRESPAESANARAPTASVVRSRTELAELAPSTHALDGSGPGREAVNRLRPSLRYGRMLRRPCHWSYWRS